MTAIWASLVIVDFVFLDESQFLFEPDIKTYQRKTAPRY
jgi:hypothetical protein